MTSALTHPLSARFLELMGRQQWRHGGYWVARMRLDASIWLKVSRPRTALPVPGLIDSFSLVTCPARFLLLQGTAFAVAAVTAACGSLVDLRHVAQACLWLWKNLGRSRVNLCRRSFI